MAATSPVRLLIADDHVIFRAALRSLIESEPGFQVVGEASDGAEAVKMAGRLQPDVVLLDLAMPGASGLEVLSELTRTVERSRIIILTARIERAQIVDVLQAGARGVIMKESSVELLFQGIRAVVAGEHWVVRKRVTDLSRYFRSTAQTTHSPTQRFGLTPRELQVVWAVVAGDSNRDIAERLAISQDTAKHHLSNIFDKLGVSNRLELALFAYNHRLVDNVTEAPASPADAGGLPPAVDSDRRQPRGARKTG